MRERLLQRVQSHETRVSYHTKEAKFHDAGYLCYHSSLSCDHLFEYVVLCDSNELLVNATVTGNSSKNSVKFNVWHQIKLSVLPCIVVENNIKK